MNKQLKSIGKEDFFIILKILSDTVIRNEVYFCELDSAAGDGDFGMSLAKGFKVLQKEILASRGENVEDIGSLLRSCGMVLMENCGGASGPLWGTAFLQAGKYALGKDTLDLREFAELGQALVDGVQKRGGAQVGDKTLLDALIPAVESLKDSGRSNLEDFITAMGKAVQAAEAGVDATKHMVAKKGRATYLGQRSIEHPDAGAAAIGVILREIYRRFFLGN